MDTVDKATRSRIMASIRSTGNRSTEQRLRMLLVRHKITGWQVANRLLLGNPDFVFPKAKLVIFVDGCFWHACPKCSHRPKSNRQYWDAKIQRNIARDKRTRMRLRRAGWSVLRIWEHELKENPRACIAKIKRKLSQD
jgi:DNA mismatch endonuclease, patch repair protein